MHNQTTITLDNLQPTREALSTIASSRLHLAVLQAAAQDVIVATREHFAARESEPRNNQGFPAFGKQFPKRYFWSGSHGNSVAESIQPPEFDTSSNTATIKIDSPALAHKADPNPPLITPKGGRKKLAIPASVRAAAYAGMPRDFDPGGGLTFAYALTPDDRWMPALVAARNNQRTYTRGSRAGQRVSATLDRATQGQGEPHYWLVSQVQTAHDPKALPDQPTLQNRANLRAAKTLQLLTQQQQG